MIRHLFVTTVVLLCLAPLAQAKRFTNDYVEFELPPLWECAREGGEWICQSTNKDRQKEAIMILAAKVRGEQDAIDRYQAYLKTAKSFILPGGRTQVSEPTYTKLTEVNTHNWVDSMHLASEVPGFYTRYLATTESDIGVVVTFSVSKEHYAAYKAAMDALVASLRVFRPKSLDLTKYVPKKTEDVALEDTGFVPQTNERFNIAQGKGGGRGGIGSAVKDNLVYILLGLVIGGWLLWSKRKKK